MKLSFFILIVVSSFAKAQVNLKNMKSFHRNSDSVEYQTNIFSIKQFYDSLKFEKDQFLLQHTNFTNDTFGNFGDTKEETFQKENDFKADSSSMKISAEKVRNQAKKNSEKLEIKEASVWPTPQILSSRRKSNPKISNLGTKPISKDVIALMSTIYRLDSFVCYIGNQNNIYSCSAWVAAGLESINDNIKKNKKYGEGKRDDKENFYSPSFIYTKAKESLVNSQCNEGIDLIDALSILKDYGAPTLKTCEYFTNDFNCKIDELSKYSDEAKLHRIVNFVPVDVNIIDFKYVLSHNCAIALEINIDDNFIYQGQLHKWTKENPYIWHAYVASSKFGRRPPHSVICVGYNDNIGAFLMVNSFGKNFGNNGFFLMNYDFMFKKGVVKQAYRLKTDIYDSTIHADKSKIDKLNSLDNLVTGRTILELGEGKSGEYLYKLKFQCISEDFDEDIVHLKIFNEQQHVIRKDVSLSYGICTFFSYREYNYYIQLLDMIGPTKSLGGLIESPPKINLLIFKIKNNKN